MATVTACIPTFNRAVDLARTLDALLDADQVPDLVLVSEGYRDARAATQEIASSVTRVPCILLPPPDEPNRSGNRNWLTTNVRTPFTLFLDDDVDVHPAFLRDAMKILEEQPGLVLINGGALSGPPGWVTTRGHFRPARAGEPVAFSFSTSLWRTETLRRYPLEERLRYGYEDSDMAFRMKRAGELRNVAIDRVSVHRGVERTADVGEKKHDLANSARVFVKLRRFWDDYAKLVAFLILEMVANLYRLRRPLPGAEVSGQWRALAWRLLGVKRPNTVTQTVGTIGAAGTTDSSDDEGPDSVGGRP